MYYNNDVWLGLSFSSVIAIQYFAYLYIPERGPLIRHIYLFIHNDIYRKVSLITVIWYM